jgi:hypothetical protein
MFFIYIYLRFNNSNLIYKDFSLRTTILTIPKHGARWPYCSQIKFKYTCWLLELCTGFGDFHSISIGSLPLPAWWCSVHARHPHIARCSQRNVTDVTGSPRTAPLSATWIHTYSVNHQPAHAFDALHGAPSQHWFYVFKHNNPQIMTLCFVSTVLFRLQGIWWLANRRVRHAASVAGDIDRYN